MRFELTDDQRDFSAALDGLLSLADCAKVARSWANGDSRPGLALWDRLATQGVTALGVPDSGATPVDLCVAFERLGWWAVPGPWVESVAYLPVALGDDLSDTIATVAVPPQVPWALDAHVAEQSYLVLDGTIHRAEAGQVARSVDRTRHLFTLNAGEQVGGADQAAAFDLAVLCTSAQLLGVGERLLADAVTYANQRRQFGREIGSYQAIKHALADVRIALDFARPLVYGAALGAVPVSAAKVATGDATHRASRVGLQVHGAIGYTAELDLSIWLTKARALLTAWGTPAFHRARVLEGLR